MFSKEKFKYDNIEELKQDVGLKVGDVVQILGWLGINDGCKYYYQIVYDNKDGKNIKLNNGLYAKRIEYPINIYKEIFIYPRTPGHPELGNCRIPGLITTNKGTLVAVCDLRKGFGDLPNQIKIGMKKSLNQGLLWTDTKIIMDLGDEPTQGLSDPCIIHNPDTGRTFCFAVNVSKGGVDNPGTEWGFYMSYSDDDCENWTTPKNISSLVPSGWKLMFQGPGRGCYHKGVIYIPIQCWQGPDGTRAKSGIMYSSDNGVNWTVSSLVDNISSECAVTVYKDRVYLSCKDEEYKYGRFLFVSNNKGQTWTEIIQDTYSTSTQGSLITIAGQDTTEVLVKCENNGTGAGSPRNDMTIKVSQDGIFWKDVVQVRNANGSGYSCLTYDNDYLYVHYETSAGCVFKRFPIQQFRDIAVRSLTYNASVLTNPSVFEDAIYVQDTTETVLITKDMSSTPISRIKSSFIGKRIKFLVVGETSKLTLKNTDMSLTPKYSIKDIRIPLGSEYNLKDGDSITLVQSRDNTWMIDSIDEFKPTTFDTLPSDGILDMNNYLIQTANLTFTGTIKGFKNVTSRGKIRFLVRNFIVLDLGEQWFVDGANNKRIFLKKGCSFELIDSYQTGFKMINVYGKPNNVFINRGNQNLLEYNTDNKSISLFDNVSFYTFSNDVDILNNEINYIRLSDKTEVPFVRFLFWYTGTGKISNPSGTTKPSELYRNVVIPSARGEITFTSGAVIDIMNAPYGQITAVKF